MLYKIWEWGMPLYFGLVFGLYSVLYENPESVSIWVPSSSSIIHRSFIKWWAKTFWSFAQSDTWSMLWQNSLQEFILALLAVRYTPWLPLSTDPSFLYVYINSTVSDSTNRYICLIVYFVISRQAMTVIHRTLNDSIQT